MQAIDAKPNKRCAVSLAGRQLLCGLRPDVASLLNPLTKASTIDLSRNTRRTRRALRLLSIAQYWSRRSEADEYEIPPFSPKEAELRVVYLYERWFVTFRDLRYPASAPIEDRQPLLLVEADPSKPLGLSFLSC